MTNWNDIRSFIDLKTGDFRKIPEGAKVLPVVGLTFIPGYPTNILALLPVVGSPVYLVRNPDNKYDSNAIEVRFEGVMLGHLAKDVAASLAPEMDNGTEWWASIYQVRVSPENPNNPGLDILVDGFK